MRAFAVILVAGVAAIALTVYAGWDDASAPTPASTSSDEPKPAPSAGTPVELVRAAAGKSPKVESVVCHTFSDDVVLCAVTFAGPSCQLWQVTDGVAIGLSLIVEGATGVKTRTGVRC